MAMLRLMSNNIWCCGDNDPRWAEKGEDCSAEHRAKGIVSVYKETLPDVIGLQECTARLANNLMQLFKDGKEPYALLWGRDTPIIYRTDKFELIDSDYLIYPLNIPGYEGELDRVEELRIKYNCPAVIVGDFNAKYDSLAFKSAFSRGYVHGHDIATEYRDEKNGTTSALPKVTTITKTQNPLRNQLTSL